MQAYQTVKIIGNLHIIARQGKENYEIWKVTGKRAEYMTENSNFSVCVEYCNKEKGETK